MGRIDVALLAAPGNDINLGWRSSARVNPRRAPGRRRAQLALDPTAGDPLGTKSGGEGSISPAAAAAVIDALAGALNSYSIDHIDMPATPLGTP